MNMSGRSAVRAVSVVLALSAGMAAMSPVAWSEVQNQDSREPVFTLEPKPWMKAPSDDDFDNLPIEEKRKKALAEISKGVRDATQEARIKAADAHWESYLVNLPDAQMNELIQYTLTTSHNRLLREGTGKLTDRQMKDFVAGVGNTDKALSGHPADAAYIVARGANLSLSPDEIKKLRGRTLTDKGFLSTTLMDKPPADFELRNSLLRLRIPELTSTAYLSKTAAMAKYEDEQELLLGRGTAINVTRSFCGTPDASVEGGCKQWEVFGEVVLRQVQLTVETSGDAGVKGHVVF
ncbi:ADP-ribosyltransferase, partial [Brucella intermedia]|uniref:ADP-ribosyltransferase n=1 Tax=Brucella intermedia TaxID=94625 RepID=UPI0011153405